jgi:hypothetical protein
MKMSRRDKILKWLLWVCILAACAGLAVQTLGSDLGMLMAMLSMAIGAFPAFHFAAQVAAPPRQNARATGGSPDQDDATATREE